MATIEEKLDAILEYLYFAYLDSKQTKSLNDGKGNMITYYPNPYDALKNDTSITTYIAQRFSVNDIGDIKNLLDRLLTSKMITSKKNGDTEFIYTIENLGIDFHRNDGYVKQQYIKKLKEKKLEREVHVLKNPIFWQGVIASAIAIVAIYFGWKHI